MSTSMSSDEIAVEFARVYGAIVDQVELPSSDLPAPGLTSPSPRRQRGPLTAMAAAFIVVLGLGGVALLWQLTSVAEPATVERVTLAESPTELGAPVELIDVRVDEAAGDEVPDGLTVWLWEADDDPGRIVALAETAPTTEGQALSDLLSLYQDGQPLTAPTAGQVDEIVFDSGRFGRSWIDGEVWRITVGTEEAAVVELTDETRNTDPGTVSIDGFHLGYDGPQTLDEGSPLETVDMFYRSPAGDFGVGLARGLPFFNALLRIQLPAQEWTGEPTLVDGADAYMITARGDVDMDPFTVLSWQIDDTSSAYVVGMSDTFEPELMHAIAEGVAPISFDDWEQLVADVPPPTPVDPALTPLGDQVVIASGTDWELRAQTYAAAEDSANPGQLGICGWLALLDSGELADIGCAGAALPFGNGPHPFSAETGDGILITGAAPAGVDEIRIEAERPDDTVTTQPEVVDAEVPFGWWAVVVPEDVTYTSVTFWDEDGNRVHGGGRLRADEILRSD